MRSQLFQHGLGQCPAYESIRNAATHDLSTCCPQTDKSQRHTNAACRTLTALSWLLAPQRIILNSIPLRGPLFTALFRPSNRVMTPSGPRVNVNRRSPT